MTNKIWIVFKREYLQKIKSKSFIITTFLGPIILVGLIALIAYLSVELGDDSEKVIAVLDETGVLYDDLESAQFELTRTDQPPDSLRTSVRAGEIDGYLVLPTSILNGEGEAEYFSLGGGGLSFNSDLQRMINRAVQNHRVIATGASEEVLEIFQQRVGLRTVKVTEEGEEADSTIFSSGIGYGMGMLMYIFMLLYGSLVMRGVLEEKTSRIMEVVVSSARPFELMMGKVLGIGAVGLTQFFTWGLLSFIGMTFAGSIALSFVDTEQLAQSADLGSVEGASQEAVLEAAGIVIPDFPAMLIVYFALYFLGGYLLYASAFAAVGSAVDQESDAQQFLLPAMAPVILAVFFMAPVLSTPDSLLALVVTLIPFFSPILMPVRLAVTNVPFWELALSLLLLYATFVGVVWVSSRIYRVGILMYGKKPSFKDLFKWIRYA